MTIPTFAARSVRGTKTLILLTAVSTASFGAAITIAQPVSATAGPWNYTNGGLNTDFQYGAGNQAAPAIVNATSGLDFHAGDALTLSYVSGLVAAGPAFPAVDANGETSIPFNNSTGSTGKVAPSAYMNPSTYPINLMELVGTFVDGAGGIVGTPFAIGNSTLAVNIPAGAAVLQMGINDDNYGDNSGAFLVDITGPGSPMSATPEPSTAVSLLTGLVLIALAVRLRRRGASAV